MRLVRQFDGSYRYDMFAPQQAVRQPVGVPITPMSYAGPKPKRQPPQQQVPDPAAPKLRMTQAEYEHWLEWDLTKMKLAELKEQRNG